MNNYEQFTPKEVLPEIDSYIDENGDVRHVDDDLDGFSAEGHAVHDRTNYSRDEHSRDEAVVDERYSPERVEDGDVDLQALLDAAKAFAHANQLAGLIKSRLHSHHPARNVLRERENSFSLGTVKYKLAMGYRALKESAVAEGVAEEEFDHHFMLGRNEFYSLNKGEAGKQFRKHLKTAIDNAERD